MSLGSRLAVRIVVGMFVVGMMLFLPAGTLRFWQGWAYLAVWFIPGLVFSLYFYKRDPRLVERRLESKEKEKEQKVVMGVVYVVFLLAYLIAGLDFRFGWTYRWTGPVPLWLEIASLTTVLASYLMTIWVMDVNRYAARTIRVEAGQKGRLRRTVQMGPSPDVFRAAADDAGYALGARFLRSAAHFRLGPSRPDVPPAA